ncbi:hypothetical protein ACLEPN_16665 [Myxococcus sp. 1LA]
MSLGKGLSEHLKQAAKAPHVPARVRSALETWHVASQRFNDWFLKVAKVRLTTEQIIDDVLEQDDACFDATEVAWLNYQTQPTPENEAVLLSVLAEWVETDTRLIQKYGD